MSEHFSKDDESTDMKEKEKPFKCSGCSTPLDRYDEKCPNCERLNPNYFLK